MSMHRPARAGRSVVTALFLLTAAAWILGRLTPVAWAGLGPVSVGLGAGRAWIDRTGPWTGPPGPGLFIGADILPDGWLFRDNAGTWRVNRNSRRYTGIRIWPWACGLAAAAALAWHGRRTRPGHCACGYDLRGVRAGADGSVTCPECGAVANETPPAGRGGR